MQQDGKVLVPMQLDGKVLVPMQQDGKVLVPMQQDVLGLRWFQFCTYRCNILIYPQAALKYKFKWIW